MIKGKLKGKEVTVEEFIKGQKKKRIGHLYKQKDVGRKGYCVVEIVAITYKVERGNPQKIYEYTVRELKEIRGITHEEVKSKFEKFTDRIAYYIIGENGKWTFGQFNTIMLSGEREEVIALARKEGTYLEKEKGKEMFHYVQGSIKLTEKEKEWLRRK